MFNLDNEKVEGIVAEEGGMSSHAAILARGMGIPTVTGIRDLPRLLREGDLVVLDATAGELVTSPDERAMAEATMAAQRWKAGKLTAQAPTEITRHQTRDGTPVRLLGSCGSAGEADLVRTFGMEGIGVYRTELQFLAEDARPTEESLVTTYRQVVQAWHGRPLSFRLLDVPAANHGETRHPERNPTMGVRGVRGLLAHSDVLRMQLRALLRATAGSASVSVLIPFVTGLSDLQRAKAALTEERVALKKAGVPCATDLQIAPIIEVPAAAMSLGALLNESDFAVVAVDDLQAHLLAADRDNAAVREYHEMVHPAVFELLARMAKDAERRDKPVVLFGESAADPVRVPFYLGVGYRSLSIAPVRLRGVLKVLARYSLEECRRIAARILEAPRTLDVQKVLVNIDVG
jgi:phosphotransferase system enzyme I (PtsI)